jgi:dGTPase
VLDLVSSSSGRAAVEFSPSVLEAVDELRAFMFEHVYLSPRQRTEHVKAKHVVKELFQHYLANPDQALGGRPAPTDPAELTQLVCDYVAGMTDRYVMERYAEALLPHTA